MHAMKLHEYLEQNGITAHQFARQTGINHATISRLLNNGQMPRADTAWLIEGATGGAVTLADWQKKGDAA